METQSPLGSLFHSNEDILKAMMQPDYLWDAMHHHSFFLLEKMLGPNNIGTQDIYTIETKYFLPYGKANWFKNPILALDMFQEGNMSNISLTIKVNISRNLEKVE